MRYFWLVKGKHASANWHVFTALALAEDWASKHYKKFSEKGYEIIQVAEVEKVGKV